jgi:acyl carrier protein
MAETTSQRVIRVIAETQKIPPDHVTAESTFEELRVDSLDGLNILFALEEEFGVDVPDDEGRQFRSVGQIVDGIEQLLARKAT